MNKICVLLDPGHGTRNYTKGKCSPDKQLYEGEWNREFANMLMQQLDNEGITYHNIVPEDNDISLNNRCLRANIVAKNFKQHGFECVYISVHINAAASDVKYHDANGFSAWVYTNASEKSKELGKLFVDEAKKMKLTGNRSIPKEGCNSANFAVLRGTSMPAVLCENMFMDNKKDEEFLQSKQGKEMLIELYINTIYNYMKKYNLSK